MSCQRERRISYDTAPLTDIDAEILERFELRVTARLDSITSTIFMYHALKRRGAVVHAIYKWFDVELLRLGLDPHSVY